MPGATGFAGARRLERLAAGGGRVHAWGHTAQSLPRPSSAGAEAGGQTPWGLTPIPVPLVTWTAVDLLDRAAVRDALSAARPSVIYHCAGLADVVDAWRAPARALRVNVLGTHNLLE